MWPCHAACGISVSHPGNPSSWPWKWAVLTPGPPGNALHCIYTKGSKVTCWEACMCSKGFPPAASCPCLTLASSALSQAFLNAPVHPPASPDAEPFLLEFSSSLGLPLSPTENVSAFHWIVSASQQDFSQDIWRTVDSGKGGEERCYKRDILFLTLAWSTPVNTSAWRRAVWTAPAVSPQQITVHLQSAKHCFINWCCRSESTGYLQANNVCSKNKITHFTFSN